MSTLISEVSFVLICPKTVTMNSKMFVTDIYHLNFMSFVTKMGIRYLTMTSMFAKMYSSRYMQKITIKFKLVEKISQFR